MCTPKMLRNYKYSSIKCILYVQKYYYSQYYLFSNKVCRYSFKSIKRIWNFFYHNYKVWTKNWIKTIIFGLSENFTHAIKCLYSLHSNKNCFTIHNIHLELSILLSRKLAGKNNLRCAWNLTNKRKRTESVSQYFMHFIWLWYAWGMTQVQGVS